MGAVGLGPGPTATLEDVVLRAPDGTEALTASRMRLALDPRDLRNRKITAAMIADEPMVNLSPDEHGTPALMRALAPARPSAEQGPAALPVFDLDLGLRDARVLREAALVERVSGAGRADSPGEPEVAPGDEEGRNLEIDAVDLALRLRMRGEGMDVSADAVGRLVQPAERRFHLHARGHATADGRVDLETARVGLGGSTLALDDGTWTGEWQQAVGTASIRVEPDELAIVAPESRPEGTLVADVRFAPGEEGGLEATGRASVAGAGALDADVRVREGGRVTGTARLDRVEPPAWGVSEDRLQELSGRIRFERAPSGRVEARMDAGPVTFEGGDRYERVRGEVVREPDGAFRLDIEELRSAGGRGRERRERDGGADEGGGDVREDRDADGDAREDDQGAARERNGPQQLSIRGTFPVRSGEPLTVRARNVSVGDLPSVLLPEAARALEGTVDLFAHFDEPPGTDRPPAGTVSLHWRGARWRAYGPGDLIANARIARGRADVTADLVLEDGGRARLQADAPLGIPGPRDHVSLTASVEGLSFGEISEVRAIVQAGLDHGRSWVVARGAAGGATLVRAAGTGEIDWRRLRNPDLPALLRDPPPFALTIADVDLRVLVAAGFAPYATQGSLAALVTSDGEEIRAMTTIRNGQLAQFSDLSLALSSRVEGESATASLLLRDRERGELALGLTGTYGGALSRLFAGDLAPLRWQARGSIAGLKLEEAAGQEDTAAAMQEFPDVEGVADGAFSFDGDGRSPRGWVWARAQEVAMRGNRFGTVSVAANVADGGAAAWLATSTPEGGRLAGVGVLAGDPDAWVAEPKRVRTAPLFAAVVVEEVRLEPYAVLIDPVRRLEGRVTARGVARGSIEAPDLHARIHLEEGLVHTDETGTIRGIELVATAAPDRIEIERIVAHGGRGRLHGRAVASRGAGPWTLDGRIDARNFRLRGDRFQGTIDAQAVLGGRFEHPALDADVAIDSGTIRLPEDGGGKSVQTLAEHPDFVVHVPERLARRYNVDPSEIRRVRGDRDGKPQRDGDGEAVPKPEALRAEVHVRADDDLWIRGKDVAIELKTDVTARVGGAGTRLEGTVSALRGNASVVGKKFVVDRARVLWADATPRQGRLDVRAVHTLEDPDRTKVIALVGGTIAKPDLDLTSEPPMPEDAVASLLILGSTDPRARAGTQEQASLAGRAATFVGNYLTAQLRQELQQVVPVDVLELETGGATATSEGRLRVGKYLAPGLFLSYAHAFGAEDDEGANQVRLEYRFHRAWFLISEYTDESRATVDVVWQREF